MPDEFTHDVFLSHSSKDKAVVRAVAERLREAGLRLWFDEWEIPVAVSRQSAAFSSENQRTEGEKDGGALPRRRYAEKIEEGLEHSRAVPLAHRMGEESGVRAANAFGSDWAQLEAGTCRSGNFWERQLAVRAPLNKERRFIPLRLDDAPIKGSPARGHYSSARQLGLFRLRMLWHITPRDLRAVARRMEGMARPDSAGAFPAQRGTVRAIPRDGRQP